MTTTTRFRTLSILLLVCAAWLAACDRAAPIITPADAPAGATHTSATADTAPPVDWIGTWNGPEGTSLNIRGVDGESGVYTLAVKSPGGEREFQGKLVGGGVAFERDGTAQLLRATDGDATGMKELAGKQKCLTVQPGEGYCRD